MANIIPAVTIHNGLIPSDALEKSSTYMYKVLLDVNMYKKTVTFCFKCHDVNAFITDMIIPKGEFVLVRPDTEGRIRCSRVRVVAHHATNHKCKCKMPIPLMTYSYRDNRCTYTVGEITSPDMFSHRDGLLFSGIYGFFDRQLAKMFDFTDVLITRSFTRFDESGQLVPNV